MKNRKGFTLVELLVVVVILGIITAISIPLIRNLQDSMTKKKYTTYLNGLKTSAKLYNDSYSEDMFGRNKVGVYCVSYAELESKKLIKDINVEDVSCDRQRTFVRVTKIEDKYTYSPFLACGDKNNANNIKVVLPDGSTSSMEDSFCTGEVTDVLNLNVDKTHKGESFNKKRKTTKITISSVSGINNNVKIYAKWSMDANDQSDEGFEQVAFKIDGDQKSRILNGEIISSVSKEFVTPKNGDGKYYLIVRVDAFEDLYGNGWKGDKFISTGPFAVDSIAPEITQELNVTSTTDNYNNLKANVKFTSVDNHTSAANLKMCVSYSGYCTNYIPYNGNSTITFNGGYDGSEKTVYLTVKDAAGNTTKVSKKYKVGITHTITYNNNSGSGCNSKSVTHNVGDNATWGTLCTPTRTGYTFSGWKNGSTVVNASSKITENISVTAQWTINRYTLTYNSDGGSSCSSVTKNYNEAWGTLCTPTKTGYTFGGWKNGTTTITSTSKATANITAKAQWTINKYTLKYDNDGGSGCSGSITKNYNTAWGTLCTPSRTGYTFAGWKNGSTAVTSTSKATANITVKAQWTINRYTLTYSNNGGSGCSSVTKNYNEAWGTLCTPSRTGYNFTGWKSGSTTITSSSKATANITATAQWSIKSFTLTINSNGGSGCSGTITKTYGSSWGLSCTPSRTGYNFGGWTISPGTATGNGSAVAKWNAKNGWELSNPGSGVLDQKWIYWENGNRVWSGWKYLPAGSSYFWFYFINGIAHDGWLNDGGVWYYLTHEDLNRDGTKDCRMLANECRWVRPENACWCFDPNGHSTGRHDGMCAY